MQTGHRHQCLIYEGAPSLHLPALAAAARDKLRANHRCLYLNTRPMVAGMQSYMAAAGVDVTHETAKGSLVLSSEQLHLMDGHFDLERMLHTLEDFLERALSDGYVGLWATGDMSWEMGPEKNFSKLMEYEWRLEQFMQTHPELSGICQYRADTLPREVTKQAREVHASIFVNETLSIVNTQYVPHELPRRKPSLDSAVGAG